MGCTKFKDLSELHDLLDLFRIYHPSTRAFTFSSSQHNMSTRLDRCYITKLAVPFTGGCKYVPLPSSISDHEAAVTFIVRALNSSERGSGYWKLNISLLKRPGFKKLTEKTIADFKSAKSAYPDTRSWWESLKLAIRLVTELYAKEQARRRKRTIKSLEKQILQINTKLCNPSDDSSLASQKERLSLMLADYYQDVHAAAKLKAGAKHALDGEKPTAYFSSLIKARSLKSVITEIEVCSGSTTTTATNLHDILNEAISFYSNLYSAKATDKGAKRASFLGGLSAKLSDGDK